MTQVTRCGRCGKPHLPTLPCWRGKHVTRVTVLYFTLHPLRVCYLCGKSGADTLDHIIARADGGTDELENLRPAHRSCNSSRGRRDPFAGHVDDVKLTGDPLSSRWRTR